MSAIADNFSIPGDMNSSDQQDDGSATQLFARMQQGDQEAAEDFWLLMAPRMLQLAQSRMNPVVAARLDPSDAVQSAFTSFWKKAQGDGFAGELRTNNLWNLLRTILLRKLGKKYRSLTAQKRGAQRELNEAAFSTLGDEGNLLGQLPGKAAEPGMRLELAELLNKLDEECQTIVAMRLAGYTNAEIAQILGCTERKIERKLHVVRLIWQDDLERDV